jgi:uncharacterized protein DUF1905
LEEAAKRDTPRSKGASLLDQLNFTAELWLHSGKGGWTFITLPKDSADQIRFYTGTRKGRAWGMIKVKARIGSSEWSTTIWPDKASGSFLLPVKVAVRKKENIAAGDDAEVSLTVLTPPGL